MPAPTTDIELIDLIQKSGVVEAARLTTYLQQLRDQGTLSLDPSALTDKMVQDGILTFFQAEQLLQGKWKRFTIGKYKVLERLGVGGMGQVFLCEHKLMRRLVAVKVLPTARAEEPDSLERFYREARAVAALDHPNLVRAFDIDQNEALHFLVLEYVDGANLQDIVRKSGPLDPVRACHYIYKTALGLQYAYEVAGLVHRDIKPSNILVDRSGQVKILDMGLARFFHDQQDMLTKKSDESVLGTADYFAPEQALDSHKVDIRGDIYSLGATFYYLLAGQPPFADGSVAQKLIWHQTRQPKPIRLLRPEVPVLVAAIQERMLSKDPGARYQSPADLALALAPFVQTPILPPLESELPQLSPAVCALGVSGPTNLSSRIGIPLPTPVNLVKNMTSNAPPSNVGAAAASTQRNHANGCAVTGPTNKSAIPSLERVSPPASAGVHRVARNGARNPYSSLIVSGETPLLSAGSNQIYATGATSNSTLCMAGADEASSGGRNGICALVAMFIALLVCSGYAYWQLFIAQS